MGLERHHLCMEDDRPLVTQMGAPRFPRGPDDVVQSPSRHDVEQAIRRLDGKEFHDVYLVTSDPAAFLGICGGPDRYAVVLTDHEQFGLADNIMSQARPRKRSCAAGSHPPSPATTWSTFRLR